MKLPKNTLLAPEKFFQYLLLPRAADDKSRFLNSAGYTRDQWQVLEDDLRKQILVLDAYEVEQTKYGTIYEICGNLQGPNGKVLAVVTIWITEIATDQTKFVTLFPDKGRKS